MSTRIRFMAGEAVFDGMLNDSETASAIARRLPVTFAMSRWGEEYYGNIGEHLGMDEAGDARSEMKIGELAYWPVGNALCIFFGPTPASTGPEPVAASNVNPVGMLEGDLDGLKAMGGSIEVTVEKA